ncbi:class I SAM-dependent methyltransferase [Amycolatopsis sp. NPDC059657]|uniref:class I SAM-dependent methyltransferase n=1 Tax=Amycolatopsis sp. NPDC059657 TaxID=3346899 RepID=UPI0036732A27
MTADRPRWLLIRETPVAARVIHKAYGGSYVRHLVKVLVTPYLTARGHAAVLGVGADHGRSGLARRILDSVVHVAWALTFPGKRQEALPWVLRPSYVAGWRLVNLAKDSGLRDAASATIALSGHVFALADRIGMDVVARVDTTAQRLLTAYLRRGFRVTGSDSGALMLYRSARDLGASPLEDKWRSVLRTGRLTLSAWTARFGPAEGPFLDLGAGDSPLGTELASSGVVAFAADPQYSLRRRNGGYAVAATAEHLPFPTGAFATVNANFVMQHAARPRRALGECLRVSGPEGRLVLHPVWAPRSVRARLGRIPGVLIVPGRALPPRRQRPSITLSARDFDLAAHGAEVVAALCPHPVVAWLGRVAMRLVIVIAEGRPR